MTANRFLLKYKIYTLIILFVLPLMFINSRGEAKNYDDSQDVEMVKGDLQSVKVKNLVRVSITNPDIADISDAQPEEVMVMAKQSGQTVMFIWDDAGKRSVIIRVIEEDLALVKARIAKLVQKAEIKGVSLDENTLEGRVVVTGALELEDKEKMDKILEVFLDEMLTLVRSKAKESLISVILENSFEKLN